MTSPRSTARIMGNAVHPMLVAFPIALFVATLACDVAFWRTGDAYWAMMGQWVLGTGLLMAALAALAGAVDVLGAAGIRALRETQWHAGGNALMALIQIVSWYLRFTEGPAAVVPMGLVLSGIAVGIMLFTGWKGWQMIYRHRVRVSGQQEAPSRHRQPRPAA